LFNPDNRDIIKYRGRLYLDSLRLFYESAQLP
jgi:hypothetical protein